MDRAGVWRPRYLILVIILTIASVSICTASANANNSIEVMSIFQASEASQAKDDHVRVTDDRRASDLHDRRNNKDKGERTGRGVIGTKHEPAAPAVEAPEGPNDQGANTGDQGDNGGDQGDNDDDQG